MLASFRCVGGVRNVFRLVFTLQVMLISQNCFTGSKQIDAQIKKARRLIKVWNLSELLMILVITLFANGHKCFRHLIVLPFRNVISILSNPTCTNTRLEDCMLIYPQAVIRLCLKACRLAWKWCSQLVKARIKRLLDQIPV